jgi:hypothetical protein
MYTPGGHESYMKELSGLFKDSAQPKPGDLDLLASKFDIEFRFDKLDEIMKKYKVHL